MFYPAPKFCNKKGQSHHGSNFGAKLSTSAYKTRRRILANACLAVCGAIRLSLVYLASTKNALPFKSKAANSEPRPAILVLEREVDWSSDSVARPMADLNAGDGTLYRMRFWVWPPLF
jgi:hypothetical protein